MSARGIFAEAGKGRSGGVEEWGQREQGHAALSESRGRVVREEKYAASSRVAEAGSRNCNRVQSESTLIKAGHWPVRKWK